MAQRSFVQPIQNKLYTKILTAGEIKGGTFFAVTPSIDARQLFIITSTWNARCLFAIANSNRQNGTVSISGFTNTSSDVLTATFSDGKAFFGVSGVPCWSDVIVQSPYPFTLSAT